ncbi:MAG: NAD(P)/FAD-dependent oxidoreductase [Candidatus Omnitrophica bacterium]|nr:NAD(P)/FAD-dependent oxidoreductase [Candidatus Omnitrophota bacterium]
MKLQYQVIIVGGGPAGMMAAIRAAERNFSVLLIEKNDQLGRKLLITGHGKCNFTHTGDLNYFLSQYVPNGKVLREALTTFSNDDLIQYFKKSDIPSYTDEGGRFFPKTDSAQSLLDVLRRAIQKLKIKVLFSTQVIELMVKNQKIYGVRLNEGTEILGDHVVISTGGRSYPATGSSGDGYHLARSMGHTVSDAKPALVSFKLLGNIPALLEGISLPDIVLKFRMDKKFWQERGAIIFTAKGISGPAVLNLSLVTTDYFPSANPIFLHMDLVPNSTEELLNVELTNIFLTHGKAQIKTVLAEYVPMRLCEEFLRSLNIDPLQKTAQVTKKQKFLIVEKLKDWPFQILAMGPWTNAMITKGGIFEKEIDFRTGQSKLVNGLYFAGEVIGVCGKTGGFNLQMAFSTGYLVGEKIVSF